MQDPQVLLTKSEISKILKVSTATLSRLIKKDGLPCLRIGRQARFELEAVLDWASRHGG